MTRVELPPPAEEGIRLFNAGYFFEAHDALEEVWVERTGREKTFYQGLIQVAAGLYKAGMKNQGGAVSLLRKGLAKLRAVGDLDTPLDLERLIGETAAVVAALERCGQAGIEEFDLGSVPRIHRRPAPES